MQLEYMQLKSGNLIDEGRVFWDTGSSRVLIRNEFARQMNFHSQEMYYPLTVVGGSEVMKGVIYEMEILDNHGIVHKTRQGFWNGSIIDEPESQDLKPVRKLFPHVPEELFEPLPAKPIDVLVGLNYFRLHPNGGEG